MTNKPAASEPAASATDLLAKLMGDWSWRPEMQPVDPGYVYLWGERVFWELEHREGRQTPAIRPWMVRAYRGPVQPPKRIGG